MRSGAVILFQFEDFAIGESLFKFQNVGNVSPAPAINRLIIVTHDRNLIMCIRKRFHKKKLRPVSILVFIHQNILELLLIFF